MRRVLEPIGPFSLEAAAGFGFGPNEGRPPAFDGAMRLAFGVDGGRGHAGAVVRQPEPDGVVEVELDVSGGADPDAALAQVARTLSLDGDGEGFGAVGERDPLIGRLQAAHRGQRPVLFHSPWEGAAWAIISARRPAAQGARVRRSLAERHGHVFTLAGERLAAFPQPDALAQIDAVEGLNAVKVERLRALAAAALDGELDVDRLHRLGPEACDASLQRLPGIGPFYAGLVTLRATGFTDAALLTAEPKLLGHAGRLYGAPGPLSHAELNERAAAWRPFRTWTTVLIRLAGERGTF